MMPSNLRSICAAWLFLVATRMLAFASECENNSGTFQWRNKDYTCAELEDATQVNRKCKSASKGQPLRDNCPSICCSKCEEGGTADCPEPTMSPTWSPTGDLAADPTADPTATPTANPTANPTAIPTMTPTKSDIISPVFVPTDTPTITIAPTKALKKGRPICPVRLEAATLQECIDLCQADGKACGNRFDLENPSQFQFTNWDPYDPDDNSPSDSPNFLSCASGCELAFYSKDRSDCDYYCDQGNDPNKRSPVAYSFGFSGFNLNLRKLKECKKGKKELCFDPQAVEETDCKYGCEVAENLPNFYQQLKVGDDDDTTDYNIDNDNFEEPFAAIPKFLFAGQSNMVGNANEQLYPLFSDIVGIVNEKFEEPLKSLSQSEISQNITARLEAAIRELRWVQQKKNADKDAAARNIAELFDNLAGFEKEQSGLNDEKILVQNPKVLCSYTNPAVKDIPFACEQPVSPTACGLEKGFGFNFGPELMFAQVFPTLATPYSGKTIGISKVAKGGSPIAAWLEGGTAGTSSDPNYWETLRDNIWADDGTLEAFVWYQGESEMYPWKGGKEYTKETYLEKLSNLTTAVRAEIFAAHRERWGVEGSPTATFASPADIPVVIIELGATFGNVFPDEVAEREPGDEKYQNNTTPNGPVVDAQRLYVADDPNSVLVNAGTADDPNDRLSYYYHQDAPSMMIIGDRLAKGLAELL